jgi:hypothetical protein
MRLRPEDFPIAIDNTMRRSFSLCERKFYWSHVLHRVKPSIHLIAGAAVAAGNEAFRRSWYTGGDWNTAFGAGLIAMHISYIEGLEEHQCPEPASDAPKGVIWLRQAFEGYWNEWHPDTETLHPMQTEDGPMVEWTFAVPIPGTSHPATKEPILYCGRVDVLAEKDGCIWIIDDKTAGAIDSKYAMKWRIDSQPTGYWWAAQQCGYNVAGAWIRAVSPLARSVRTANIPITRNPYQIQQWLRQIREDIGRMKWCWLNNRWGFELGDACGTYGGCEYIPVCESSQPEAWLQDFTLRHWNPLDITRRPLTEKEPT